VCWAALGLRAIKELILRFGFGEGVVGMCPMRLHKSVMQSFGHAVTHSAGLRAIRERMPLCLSSLSAGEGVVGMSPVLFL
jgi:hypothetical protein